MVSRLGTWIIGLGRRICLVVRRRARRGRTGAGPPGSEFSTQTRRLLDLARSVLRREAEAANRGSAEAGEEDPTAASQEPLPNLGRRWRVRRFIDEGGMGRVYEAFDRKLGRRVAIKIAKHERRSAVRRLAARREQLLLAALSHPGIVTLLDSGRLPGGGSFYVMELVRGVGLTRYAKMRRLSQTARIRLLRRVALAVAAVHRVGIVHRDLKPANILVDTQGRPRILDFGLGKNLSDASEPDSASDVSLAGLSLAGAGTKGYRSPEQQRGEAGDQRTDVYALGVLLHELIYGCRPIAGGPLRRPAAPRGLRWIIARCLAPEPGDRYADAEGLANDLRRFLKTRPVAAAPPGVFGYVAERFFARHRYAVSVGSLAAGIVCAAITVAFVRVEQGRREAEASARRARQAERGEVQARRLAEDRLHQLEQRQYRQGVGSATRLLGEGRLAEGIAALQEVPATQWGWECDWLARELSERWRPRRWVGLHRGATVAGALSPDGAWLATSGLDGQVVVRELREGEIAEVQRGRWQGAADAWVLSVLGDDGLQVARERCCTALAWAGEPLRLVGVTGQGLLTAWDPVTGQEKGRQQLSAGTGLLAGAGNQVVSTTDEALWRWDLESPPVRLVECASPATALRGYRRDLIVSGHQDGKLQVASLAEGAAESSVQLEGCVRDLAVCLADATIWVGLDRGLLVGVQVDERAGRLERRMTLALPAAGDGEPNGACQVAVSDDGQWLVAADEANRLSVWRLPEGRLAGVHRLIEASALPNLASVGQARLPMCLEIGQAGDEVFVGGRDATVIAWGLPGQPLSRRFQVEPGSAMHFDGVVPGQIWHASPAGQLMARGIANDSSIVRVTVRLADRPVLAASGRASRVAVSTPKGVAVWELEAGQIKKLCEIAGLEDGAAALALDARGENLAVVTGASVVKLWDVASGRPRVERDLGHDGPPRLIAFRPDGQELALAGPGARVRLLQAHDLTEAAEPYVCAAPATALAWHRHGTARVLCGDALGRLMEWPEQVPPTDAARHLAGRPAAALAFTPDGRRLAMATADGRTVVVPATGSNHPAVVLPDDAASAGGAPVAGLGFDASGTRLMLTRSNGQVTIWETQPGADFLPPPSADGWQERVLLRRTGDRLLFRAGSVAGDDQGQVWILYAERRAIEVGDSRRAPVDVCLGRESAEGWSSRCLQRLGQLDQRAFEGVGHSLALEVRDGHWQALFRRPVSPDGLRAASLTLCRGELTSQAPTNRSAASGADATAGISTTELTEPKNAGFYPLFVPKPTGQGVERVLHFTHRGHQLLQTMPTDGGWKTEPVGMPGDGLDLQGCLDGEGRVHLTFSPTRYNGDPQPPAYVQLAASGRQILRRETVDPEIDGWPVGITLAESGQPLVLVERRDALARAQYFVAVRTTDGGWRRQLVLPAIAGQAICSGPRNLGPRTWFVVVRGAAGRVELYELGPERVTRSLVVAALDPNATADQPVVAQRPAILWDAAGEPVVVIGFRRGAEEKLHLYRRRMFTPKAPSDRQLR